MFSICSISALLSFQLLPQPRLLGCRGGARPRGSGGGSRVFTRTFVRPGPPPCERQSHPWSLCRKKRGMISVRGVEMAAQAAFVSTDVRRPWKGQLCPWSQPSLSTSLLPTEKGSEEAWRTLENELKAPVAPFHRHSPFIHLANIGRVTLPRFPHVKKSSITTLSGVEGINEIFMKGKPLTASGT